MCSATNTHTTIIIPTHNQVAMLKRVVDGLIDTAHEFVAGIELIIVDNNSDDTATLSYLSRFKTQSPAPFTDVKVLHYPHKFNYSAMNNLAASISSGVYLCFLNNDVEIIHADWLTNLGKPLQQPTTGCVGAMLYYPDNTIQHAGVFLDPNNVAGHLYKHSPRGSEGAQQFLLSEQVVSAVTAACLLVSNSVFNNVGGFNESLAVAFNDVDFCLKVQQSGLQNIWTPHAELYHHESKSRGQSHKRSFMQKMKHRSEVRLMKHTWKTQLAHEPHTELHACTQKNPSLKQR